MDNRIFDVNGRGKKMLADTLRLLLWQQDGCYDNDKEHKAEGYYLSPTKGLVLLWHVTKLPGEHAFMVPLGADALAEMLIEWLDSEQAKAVPCDEMEDDFDHDGSNSVGWRVYCEKWGRIADNDYAFAAIKRVYLWHGK